MKVQIKIPDFLTLDQFSKLTNIEHLTDLDKMIRIITVISDKTEEEVRTWDINSLVKISTELMKLMEIQNEFHPIIEYKGKEYGFAALKNMKLGEYVDLENLCKNSNVNISKIISILYRPIKKNKLGSAKYLIKNGIKLRKNSSENIFNHYTIQDYDEMKDDKDYDEKHFDDFPLPFAMGSLVFFLATATLYLNNISSLTKLEKEIKMEKIIQEVLIPIGAGLGQFIHSQKVISCPLQEIAA